MSSLIVYNKYFKCTSFKVDKVTDMGNFGKTKCIIINIIYIII